MTSSIDGAAFVVGTLVLFGLATVGAVTVGVLAYAGALTLAEQLKKVEAAETLIELERERQKLEGMTR